MILPSWKLNCTQSKWLGFYHLLRRQCTIRVWKNRDNILQGAIWWNVWFLMAYYQNMMILYKLLFWIYYMSISDKREQTVILQHGISSGTKWLRWLCQNHWLSGHTDNRSILTSVSNDLTSCFYTKPYSN